MKGIFTVPIPARFSSHQLSQPGKCYYKIIPNDITKYPSVLPFPVLQSLEEVILERVFFRLVPEGAEGNLIAECFPLKGEKK